MADREEDATPIDSARALRLRKLDEWLEGIGANCLWEQKAEVIGNIEGWAANGRTFLVVRFDRAAGFAIFTQGESNFIDEALKDAEKRLRVGQ